MTARVLVVDDVIPNVKLLEAKLTSEYFDVLCAYSGPEALDIIAREHPDIILLDIMMPGMSGWMLSDRLKENPSWKNIPIVFLTARTDKFSEEIGRKVCKDYIKKPFDIEDLKKRIDKVLKKSN